MKDLLLFRRTLARRGYWIILVLFVAVNFGLFMGGLYAYGNLLPPESSWNRAQEMIFGIGGLGYFALAFYLFLVIIVARCKDAGIPIRFVIAGFIVLLGLLFFGLEGLMIADFLMLAALIVLGLKPTRISEEEKFRRKVIAETGEHIGELFKDEMEEIARKYTAEEVGEVIRQIKAEERDARLEEKP